MACRLINSKSCNLFVIANLRLKIVPPQLKSVINPSFESDSFKKYVCVSFIPFSNAKDISIDGIVRLSHSTNYLEKNYPICSLDLNLYLILGLTFEIMIIVSIGCNFDSKKFVLDFESYVECYDTILK